MPPTTDLIDDVLLGVKEVAELLAVRARTVHQWLRRPQVGMPEAAIKQGTGSRLWRRRDIVTWAGATGRLPDGLVAEYKRLTGDAPMARRKGGRLPTAEATTTATPTPTPPSKPKQVKKAAKKKAAAR